jgi:hypothetical protein
MRFKCVTASELARTARGAAAGSGSSSAATRAQTMKVGAQSMKGPRMSADGSYVERDASPGGEAPSCGKIVAGVYCEDDVEEEIAKAFANGLIMDFPSKTVSPPSSPVSEFVNGGASGGQEDLAKRTLIILDWDDTILTTTRLTSKFSVFGAGGILML